MNLYLGCPIWSFKDWVGNFYPHGTKASDYLREYARRLTTVEGNTTFYAVPARQTLQQWAATMPAGFRFCPKLPRAISHTGSLAGNIEAAHQFIEVMSQLDDRLGPMFLQLPPRYPPQLLADLEAFLDNWPVDIRLGVEVRHPDWFDAPHHVTLNQLLASHNMARVVIDTRPIRSLSGDRILAGSVYQRLLQARERKPDLPVQTTRTADFVFLRYIGHPQLEQNQAFITEWSQALVTHLYEGAEAYVFCHCPDERLDPWLCREFHRQVSSHIPIPSLPWDEIDTTTYEQPRLF